MIASAMSDGMMTDSEYIECTGRRGTEGEGVLDASLCWQSDHVPGASCAVDGRWVGAAEWLMTRTRDGRRAGEGPEPSCRGEKGSPPLLVWCVHRPYMAAGQTGTTQTDKGEVGG